MIRLNRSSAAWGRPEFRDILRSEIEQLDISELPLQQGLTTGSHALDDGRQVMIIRVTDTDEAIHVKAGVFYTSVIAGCSCADDPTPVDTNNEYCELQFDISKDTGGATVTVLCEPPGRA